MAKLEDCLRYDAGTGKLYWKVRRGSAVAGREAGCQNAAGYIVIRWDGKLELAHRVAWRLQFGVWPERELDHINGDASDNRLINLRPADHQENSFNRRMHADNVCGFKGVHKHKDRWRARISVSGKSHCLGLYDTPRDAHEAYLAAARKMHGEFAKG